MISHYFFILHIIRYINFTHTTLNITTYIGFGHQKKRLHEHQGGNWYFVGKHDAIQYRVSYRIPKKSNKLRKLETHFENIIDTC